MKSHENADKRQGSFPKISVITPSYNQGQFLERTIQSVIDQEYPHLEYIIIDGGSTDNSVEIIKKYEKYLAYWVSEPDQGQANAVNKGLAKATGEIIGWLNSDDIYLPECFENVVEVFRQEPDVDVVYGDQYIIDKNGRLLLKRKEISLDLKILFWGRNHIAQPALFFRREILDTVGLLDERLHYALDWEWWYRMGINGCRFKKIKKFLAATTWHFESKSARTQELFLKERREVQRQYLLRRMNGSSWSIPYLIYFYDKIYRLKWHTKKLVTRGSFDVIKGRRVLRKKYSVT